MANKNQPYYDAIVKNAGIFYAKVSKNVNYFVMALLEKGVITLQQKKELLALVKDPESVCDKILDILHTSLNDQDSCNTINALKETGNTDVADIILETYQKSQGKGGGSAPPASATSTPPVATATISSDKQRCIESVEKHPEAKQVIDKDRAATVLGKYPAFFPKWHRVYLKLRFQDHPKKIVLDMQFKNGSLEPYDLAAEMLEEWAGFAAKGATVEVFCKAMIEIGLNDITEKFLEEY